MKKYTAVWGAYNSRIVSVWAENKEGAVTKITEQLKRPGRYDCYQRWVEDGKQMIINDNVTQVVRG